MLFLFLQTDGSSALHCCVEAWNEANCSECIAFLMDRGADPLASLEVVRTRKRDTYSCQWSDGIRSLTGYFGTRAMNRNASRATLL